MPTTFLRKSFQTVCVDTVLFFALFALVGHITINYWERYTIQYELHSMKHSLHALKDTIGNIGKAYDNLNNDLKVLIFEVDKKQQDTPECQQKARLEAKCKAEILNRKRRDVEVQAMITKSDKMKFGTGDKTDNNYKKPHGREDKATGPLGINVSTNTKNPPKSTGSPPSETSTTELNHARCYRELEHCKHVCHGVGGTTRKSVMN